MKLRRLVPTLVAVASFAMFAAASPIQLTFVGGYGGPLTPGATTAPPGQNVPYYPYVINVGNGNISVICDDFHGSSHDNTTWWVNVEPGNNLSGALFYDGTNASTIAQSTLKYDKAFWLYNQLDPNGGQNEVNAAINFAVWDLFDSSSPTLNGTGSNDPNSDNTASAYWLQQATLAAGTNFGGMGFSHFLVYTPVDQSHQEFIGSEVPEPATLALLGSGLLGLGLLFKRRLGSEADLNPEL